jgi:hypothetical protein
LNYRAWKIHVASSHPPKAPFNSGSKPVGVDEVSIEGGIGGEAPAYSRVDRLDALSNVSKAFSSKEVKEGLERVKRVGDTLRGVTT